jgi:hypothetical protein
MPFSGEKIKAEPGIASVIQSDTERRVCRSVLAMSGFKAQAAMAAIYL